jgi:4-diphosphocytidyl-2-C-methyl-D-erythritol kinase
MSRAPDGVKLRAPAKINLALEVLGRRPDGYHELRTVFLALDLCDILSFQAAPRLSLEVEGRAPHGDDNLVMRAARALAVRAAGRGARIRLRKRIPTGSGLGGGSSDAAATLRGLDAFWQLGLPRAELLRIARELGADAPFFLLGGAALGTDRGDELDPLPAPATWVALSVPPFRLHRKTARVFQSLLPGEYSDGSRSLALAEALRQGGSPPGELLHNGLLPAAERAFPELKGYVEGLGRASGVPWALSGAGPACFALAPDRDAARRISASVGSLPGRRFTAPALRSLPDPAP